MQRPPFPAGAEAPVVLSGISFPFGRLFRASGQITHVLRTRAPLYSPLRAFSLDLHVLGTPPAFVLSQDQTLQLRDFDPSQLPLSRRTGMVLQYLLQTRRNAWTAFQTSACYSAFKDRASPFESSFPDSNLGHRGVTKTTVLVQVGAPYLRPALRAVKRAISTENFVALPTEGSGVLHRAFFPVKLTSAAFARLLLLRGGLLLSPLRVPRQEAGPVARSDRLRGARYVAPPRKAVKK